MATLDDILTTQKNGVVAINNLSQSLTSFYDVYQSVTGKTTSNTIDTNSIIFTGAGRLVGFTVMTGGSSTGTLYDSLIVNVIGGSYTPTAVTLVYGSPSALFAVNDKITVTGMTPSGYDVSAQTVTAIGTDLTTGAPTVTYSNATNAAITGYGTVFNSSVRFQRASVSTTAGYYPYNILISTGLVYAPGTNQTTNFTYSQ